MQDEICLCPPLPHRHPHSPVLALYSPGVASERQADNRASGDHSLLLLFTLGLLMVLLSIDRSLPTPFQIPSAQPHWSFPEGQGVGVEKKCQGGFCVLCQVMQWSETQD